MTVPISKYLCQGQEKDTHPKISSKLYTDVNTTLPSCYAFVVFSSGKHLFHGLSVRSVSTHKAFFFFPCPNRDHSFGGSISHIFKFVLSTLGKPYYFFFAWSGLEMNSTIHRVLGIPYPVTIQDVENVLKIENRILEIQAFVFLGVR